MADRLDVLQDELERLGAEIAAQPKDATPGERLALRVQYDRLRGVLVKARSEVRLAALRAQVREAIALDTRPLPRGGSR